MIPLILFGDFDKDASSKNENAIPKIEILQTEKTNEEFDFSKEEE
jgi:hypothetical protein